ncbi:MAG TPA: MBL fold metallo-hydrolase [Frankiaceae bacterium]|nr:MBL fold metallo-hydrolase [Frankiaceae bacterium]
MTYTGDVTVGGPADVRELPGLRVTKLAVGPYDNNVYLLRCATTGTTVLVDGANEAERVLATLAADPLVAIVQTHGHFDHVQAIAELRAATGARLLCHAADAGMMPPGQEPELVADGDEVAVGEATLRAIHLEGHTPGGLALLYEGDPERPHLFTGDSLFPGGVGNTQQDAARFTRLLDDVEAKLFCLPDETWVYPGHGKDTTLGAERPSIPEWRARGW